MIFRRVKTTQSQLEIIMKWTNCIKSISLWCWLLVTSKRWSTLIRNSPGEQMSVDRIQTMRKKGNDTINMSQLCCVCVLHVVSCCVLFRIMCVSTVAPTISTHFNFDQWSETTLFWFNDTLNWLRDQMFHVRSNQASKWTSDRERV